MPRIAGFAVLLIGLGFGGYVYYPELARYDAEARASRLIEEQRAREEALAVPASAPREFRTFSPQQPLFEVNASSNAAMKPAGRPVTKEARAAPAAEAIPTVPAVERSADHASAGAGTGQAGMATPAAGTTEVMRPRDEQSRYRLVRELQQELRRVGCYQGEIDGDWGPGSKRAMGAFTDRVNATLPVEQPDYILLTLVQGHHGNACGKSCPSGQVMSNDRCLPKAVVAQADRKSGRNKAVKEAVAQPPAGIASAASGAASVRDASSPAISRTAAADQQSSAREPRGAAEPLPGRMSIGGPPMPVLKSEPGRVPPPARLAEARPEMAGPSSGSTPTTAPSGDTAPKVPQAAAAGEPTGEKARPQRSSTSAHRPPERFARHAPEARLVQRPSSSSRSKRMIYDLYQRPDRIY